LTIEVSRTSNVAPSITAIATNHLCDAGRSMAGARNFTPVCSTDAAGAALIIDYSPNTNSRTGSMRIAAGSFCRKARSDV
jgi:hypothetical protein